MKNYKITEVKNQGKTKGRIRLYDNYDEVFNLLFDNTSKEERNKAILSADRMIVKNNLKYKTKKLKPLKNTNR